MWRMSPKQLLGSATALQALGYSPSQRWLMMYTEECHAQLGSFTPHQLVLLTKVWYRFRFGPLSTASVEYGGHDNTLWLTAAQVLATWGVTLTPSWSRDLMSAVERRMPKFSRSLLVDLLKGLVSLGVRLDTSSLGTSSLPVPHGQGKCADVTWICSYLR